MSETVQKTDIDKLNSLFTKPTTEPYMNSLLEVSGWVVTNDRGFTQIADQLHKLQSRKNSGIGLFIGAGGMLSMLPELNIDLVVLADTSRTVIEFNRTLTSLVEYARSPKQVVEFVSLPTNDPTYPEPDIIDLMELLDVRIKERPSELGRLIEDEAVEYGEYHWTNPDRFRKVQHALGRVPIVWAWSEVSSQQFSSALNSVSDQSGLELTFVNFTNFHEWLDITPGSRPVDNFLPEWPIGQLAALYSLRTDQQIRVACSAQEYMDAVRI